jgi:hypothetical protein
MYGRHRLLYIYQRLRSHGKITFGQKHEKFEIMMQLEDVVLAS